MGRPRAFFAGKKKIWITACILLVVIAVGITLGVLLSREAEPTVPINVSKQGQPINYNFLDIMMFKSKISGAISTYFGVKDKTDMVAAILLLAMSNARIPGEKVLLFGDFFAGLCKLLAETNLDLSESGIGNVSDEGIAAVLRSAVGPYLSGFFENTSLSEVELARVIYELLKDSSGSDEVNAILNTLGQEYFVTVTANTLSAFQLASNMGKMGATAQEARTVQTLLYALGSDYVDIIDEIGPIGVEMLLGFTYSFDLENSIFISLIGTTIADGIYEGKHKLGTLVYAAANAMKNTEAVTFEKLYAYNEIKDKSSYDARLLDAEAKVLLAKAIAEGVAASQKYWGLIGAEDRAGFVAVYADLFTSYCEMIEKTNNMSVRTDYEEYRQLIISKTTLALSAMDELAKIEYTELSGMDAEEFSLYCGYADALTAITDIGNMPVGDIIVVFFLNVMLKVSCLPELLMNFVPVE